MDIIKALKINDIAIVESNGKNFISKADLEKAKIVIANESGVSFKATVRITFKRVEGVSFDDFYSFLQKELDHKLYGGSFSREDVVVSFNAKSPEEATKIYNDAKEAYEKFIGSQS